MRGFNLSRWALEHIPLTRYLIGALLIGGILGYNVLGQDEDPPFTFRAMAMRVFWPGATAQQVAEQQTGRASANDADLCHSCPPQRLLTAYLHERLHLGRDSCDKL